MKLKFCLIFSLLIVSFVNPIWAQKIELVKDIGSPQPNTFYDDPISNPSNYFTINNRMFFIADNGQTGKEIFSSMGTAATTELLVDLNSGLADGIKSGLRKAGNKFFFMGRGGMGDGLYVSNGTVPGTQFLHPFDVTYHVNFYENSYGDSINEKVYFSKYANGLGEELWVSDGTDTGTFVIKDIYPGAQGSYPRIINQLGNTIFFTANHPNYGIELWTTDGTTDGTTLLKEIYEGPSDGISLPNIAEHGNYTMTYVFNGKLYFFPRHHNSLGDKGLWVSDGTSLGTYRLDGVQLKDCYNLFEFNNRLYFTGRQISDNTQAGNLGNYMRVCYTDGTEQGTGYYPNLVRYNDQNFFGPDFGIWNNQLFFHAVDTIALDRSTDLSKKHIELWKTNGVTEPQKHFIFYSSTGELAYVSAYNLFPQGSNLLVQFSYRNLNQDYKNIFARVVDNGVQYITPDTHPQIDFVYDNKHDLVNIGGCLLVDDLNSQVPYKFLFCGSMPLQPIQLPTNIIEGEVLKGRELHYYNGDYYLSFQANKDLGKELYKFSSVGMGLKKENKKDLQLSLYPNPVQNELTLILEEKAQYIIVNISGGELKRGYLFAGSNKIDISRLLPGNYVLMTKKMNDDVQRTKFTISK